MKTSLWKLGISSSLEILQPIPKSWLQVLTNQNIKFRLNLALTKKISRRSQLTAGNKPYTIGIYFFDSHVKVQ